MDGSGKYNLKGFQQKGLLIGALIGIALVVYGVVTTPGVNFLSVTGGMFVLIVYGSVGWFLTPLVNQISPVILRIAMIFGLIAGAIFAGEIALEYILLPQDNSLYGTIEFTSVFILYFLASIFASYRTQSFRAGLLAAVNTAVISSLIWDVAVISFFLIFRGTQQQSQVFQAEGNYTDFARSGLASFSIFIMEDFLGATFFHLVLGPLVAAILGTIGGWIGKGIARVLTTKQAV